MYTTCEANRLYYFESTYMYTYNIFLSRSYHKQRTPTKNGHSMISITDLQISNKKRNYRELQDLRRLWCLPGREKFDEGDRYFSLLTSKRVSIVVGTSKLYTRKSSMDRWTIVLFSFGGSFHIIPVMLKNRRINYRSWGTRDLTRSAGFF